MKHVFLLTIFLLFFGSPKGLTQVEFGVKGGLRIGQAIFKTTTVLPDGKVINSQSRSTDYWASPMVGMYSRFTISSRISLQAELLAVHKTWRSDLQLSTTVEQFEFTYLSLPVLFNLSVDRWGAELGPMFNFLVVKNNTSASKLVTLEPQRLELGIGLGIKRYFKRWDIGARLAYDITPFFLAQNNRGIFNASQVGHYYHCGYQLIASYRLSQKTKG